MTPWRALRDLPGVLIKDLLRYRRAFSHSGQARRSSTDGWVSLSNRFERIIFEQDAPGVICDWTWGSPLHAPQVMPFLGRKLLGAALSEWPIRFAVHPRVIAEIPKISFIFAHGGADRVPQLRRTIESIYAQAEVPCECVVVDQSQTPQLGNLPSPLTYRHLCKEGVPSGWHKSWALNVGARLSRGSILVFHDGDICAPAGYAAELVKAIDQRGFSSASLQRLLFYLDRPATAAVAEVDLIAPTFTPTVAFQNWRGGTIAVHRDAFTSLGGFDEGFVNWGGEDDEFHDRCHSIRHCNSGYLPFVHLWHEPQPERRSKGNYNTTIALPARLAITGSARAAELSTRAWGRFYAPDPLVSYSARRAYSEKPTGY